MQTPNLFVNLILGLAVLLFGRRLFWFFVGAVGFLVGFNLVPRLLPDQQTWLIIIIALIVGLIAAGLAILLQGMAVGILGFLIGGYVAALLMRAFGIDLGVVNWIIYLFAGILGAAFMALIFDWALIVLSALTGATMIVNALNVSAATTTPVLIVLFLIGVLVQAGMWRGFSRPRSIR